MYTYVKRNQKMNRIILNNKCNQIINPILRSSSFFSSTSTSLYSSSSNENHLLIKRRFNTFENNDNNNNNIYGNLGSSTGQKLELDEYQRYKNNISENEVLLSAINGKGCTVFYDKIDQLLGNTETLVSKRM